MTDFKKGLLYGIVIAILWNFCCLKIYSRHLYNYSRGGNRILFAYYTKELHPKSKAKVLRLNKNEVFDFVSDEYGKYLVKIEETIHLKDGTYETKPMAINGECKNGFSSKSQSDGQTYLEPKKSLKMLMF